MEKKEPYYVGPNQIAGCIGWLVIILVFLAILLVAVPLGAEELTHGMTLNYGIEGYMVAWWAGCIFAFVVGFTANGEGIESTKKSIRAEVDRMLDEGMDAQAVLKNLEELLKAKKQQ